MVKGVLGGAFGAVATDFSLASFIFSCFCLKAECSTDVLVPMDFSLLTSWCDFSVFVELASRQACLREIGEFVGHALANKEGIHRRFDGHILLVLHDTT